MRISRIATIVFAAMFMLAAAMPAEAQFGWAKKAGQGIKKGVTKAVDKVDGDKATTQATDVAGTSGASAPASQSDPFNKDRVKDEKGVELTLPLDRNTAYQRARDHFRNQSEAVLEPADPEREQLVVMMPRQTKAVVKFFGGKGSTRIVIAVLENRPKKFGTLTLSLASGDKFSVEETIKVARDLQRALASTSTASAR